MSHSFDKEYWESHWQRAGEAGAVDAAMPTSPYLETELAGLPPGSALDAGCGEGAEAISLAARGWRVAAADISAEALSRAAATAEAAGVRIEWIETDLSTWQPRERFDLVSTFYAHPAMPQLEFYERISDWVAPGGTLLIVGHLRTGDHGHHERADASKAERAGIHATGIDGTGATATHTHATDTEAMGAEATVTAAGVVALLDGDEWTVITAEERSREVEIRAGRPVLLHDVVVRATRRG